MGALLLGWRGDLGERVEFVAQDAPGPLMAPEDDMLTAMPTASTNSSARMSSRIDQPTRRRLHASITTAS
jgi:hypothetical protein